jgi:hypothetical protein
VTLFAGRLITAALALMDMNGLFRRDKEGITEFTDDKN